MNPCIIRLFEDNDAIDKLSLGIPKMFEMATMEIPPGNPAIGLLREHILIGYFLHELGKEKVQLPDQGTSRGFDVIVCKKPLSIKTVLANGQVKVLWTVDPLKIGLEIARDYNPEHDIFLVNVFWGKEKDSIFYIPSEVQTETRNCMKDEYLNARVGTNHRGISISSKAMKKMKADARTLRKSVKWEKVGLSYSPHERWENFWSQL